MGIVLSKLWDRLFSGKNYKIIIIGAISRRSLPSYLLCRYPAPSPRGPRHGGARRGMQCRAQWECWRF